MNECIDNGLKWMRILSVDTFDRKNYKHESHDLPYCIAPDDFSCPYKATMLRVVKPDEVINNPLCMFKRMKKYQI